MNLFYIFIGGGLGSIARYGLSRATSQWLPAPFPYGTLAVNGLSCLVLGLLVGLSMDKVVNPGLRLFLAVGFCGGFSTFSTFTFETLELVRMGQSVQAVINIVASVSLCYLAMLGGIYLSRL